MAEFLIVLGTMAVPIFVVAWAAYSIGYARGLRAPLTARQTALRAEVRRAENALGVTTPRQRSARYKRQQTRY